MIFLILKFDIFLKIRYHVIHTQKSRLFLQKHLENFVSIYFSAAASAAFDPYKVIFIPRAVVLLKYW